MRFFPGYISVAFFLFIPVEASFASNRFAVDFSSKKKCELSFCGSDRSVFETYLKKKYLALKDAHVSEPSLNETDEIYKTSQGLEKSPFFELEISSDSQSWENENLFVAEGNAKLVLHGGSLQADRIEIDKSQNILSASGNVYFRKGKTFLSASSFKYELKEKKGKLKNVYGVIDLSLIHI